MMVLGNTATSWQERTEHPVKYGIASRMNGPRGNRERCHAIVKPGEEWPGNRLCHLPIVADSTGWRHETFAEFAARITL